MTYQSKALTLADWAAQRVELYLAGWQFLKSENGVVYIRRPV